MANPKDILVITASSVEGLKIKRFIKPVSAHIVAGTNLFSDFLGGLSDVFGGRSNTYQKQLTSLYNEAIERIKYAAHEIGANCIIGLHIDMDEISGKGKSMFMLTAIGTAVVIEKEASEKVVVSHTTERFENVSVERVDMLRTKKNIIEKANSDTLNLDSDTWNFVTSNQILEVFTFLIKEFKKTILNNQMNVGTIDAYQKQFVSFIEALPDQDKLDLLYSALKEEDYEPLISRLSEILKELNLYDFRRVKELLESDNFQIQKRGVRIAAYDKPFYNKEDIKELQEICELLESAFKERGVRSMKKQLLSSKEKEVWTCECGKVNEIESSCSGCGHDIYGFKQHEAQPSAVEMYIRKKIELISESLA